MADVFVSYKRQDESAVHRLVTALQGAGVSVWWDREIAVDAAWELTIERELMAARVVIVAWSPSAVASDNVRAEARRARHEGKLIQVFLEHCDPPLFFGERQGVNLRDWRGAPADHRFQAVLAAVRALLTGKAPAQGVGYQKRRAPLWRMLAPVAVVGAACLALLATAGLARTGLCGFAIAKAVCETSALTTPPPPDPAASAAAQRQKLLAALAGRWDWVTDKCAAPATISTSTDKDGVSHVTLVSTGQPPQTGQVTAVDSGAVLTRTTTSSGTSEVWEYHPNGDQMSVKDPQGHTSDLIRCPGTS